MPGFAMYILSAVLLTGTSWLIARRIATRADDRYFLFVAAAATQLAVVSLVSSAFRAYTPLGFLAVQAVLSVMRLGVARRWKPGHGPRHVIEPVKGWSAVELLLAGAIGIALVVTLIAQAEVPILGWDERMYNASRPAYWIGYQSVLPSITHNDRQVTFPLGAELWLGWPMMMTRLEWPARLTHWLAHPAGALGVFWLARAIGAPRVFALGGALLFASTPSVMLNAGFAQKQDLWTAVFVIQAAFWVVRAGAHDAARASFLAAYAIAFAANVKITALACLPALALLVLLAGSWHAMVRRSISCTLGLLAGLVLSGLVVTVAYNARTYGHPLGNPKLSALGKPDFSLRQTWTHAVRAPLFLFEMPDIPSEPLRRSIERGGKSVIMTLGADRPLRLEEDAVWPGAFAFTAPSTGWRYSLGGTFMLPALTIAAIVALRELRRSWPSPRLSAASWAAGTAIPLFLGLVFMVRWMGGAAERYWIGAYSLAVALISFHAYRFVEWREARRALRLALAAAALIWAVYPSIVAHARRVDWASSPERAAGADEPFADAIAAMPKGARILAFLSQATRDYPLFRPRDGYPNYVASWGKARPDRERLVRLIERHRITHVLFSNQHAIGLHWDGGIDIRAAVEWTRSLPGARQVPIKAKDQVLFELPASRTPP
ncbi:MAG: hypothetical protein ACKVW3_03485 [Phycisphaerales bacterium]